QLVRGERWERREVRGEHLRREGRGLRHRDAADLHISVEGVRDHAAGGEVAQGAEKGRRAGTERHSRSIAQVAPNSARNFGAASIKTKRSSSCDSAARRTTSRTNSSARSNVERSTSGDISLI